MSVTEQQSRYCHDKLPIDADEEVLAIYHHHSFAYVMPLLIALFVIAVTLGLTMLVTRSTGVNGEHIVSSQYQWYAFLFAGIFSVATLVFSYIPIWLRLQEELVLTDEAVLQVLQTSLFSNKVSQTSLANVADVSVRQDFLGNLLGYGKLTIETPGEQDNYEYVYLARPHDAARQIIEAHENFAAALESGRLPTTMAGGSEAIAQDRTQVVTMDSQQYQEYLRYQRQQAQDQAQNEQPK